MTGPLGPLVDLVAGIKASVHTKLLAGFLMGVVLLLGMAVLCLVVIENMSQRVAESNRLQTKIDTARQMEYEVTGQSHYRAMALLTQDSTNNDKIAAAKQAFAANLTKIEALSPPPGPEFFATVTTDSQQFDVYSAQVLQLYTQAVAAPAGSDQQKALLAQAVDLHLKQEHPLSHKLEAEMRNLEVTSLHQIADAGAAFNVDRQLLIGIVALFSVVALGTALLFGFVISWSIVRPVRTVDNALAGIAAGDFGRRVRVRNRDELGTMTQNLNATTDQLSTMYDRLTGINDSLKRYVSPQLAESILSGKLQVHLGVSKRANLTIFFSDIRGFTPMSEHIEPEELVDYLNQYLSAMTDIVFKHGGTLDKYIGDAIMVFFGDPEPYEDHAARAVAMALEMRTRLNELQEQWFEQKEWRLTVGMGISTGYVTVGNIGSAARMEYTVLGNHVNLASRLADRAEAGQILISERTLVQVREMVDAKEIDEVELEGVSRPVKIYEVSEKASVGEPA